MLARPFMRPQRMLPTSPDVGPARLPGEGRRGGTRLLRACSPHTPPDWRQSRRIREDPGSRQKSRSRSVRLRSGTSFEARLLQNAVERPRGQLVIRPARHGNQSMLRRVAELVVAAARPDVPPTVGLDEADHLAHLHCPHYIDGASDCRSGTLAGRRRPAGGFTPAAPPASSPGSSRSTRASSTSTPPARRRRPASRGASAKRWR